MKYLEIYKCLALTGIVALLALIHFDRPKPVTPVTLARLRSKEVQPDQVPVVYVRSGNVDVTNSRPIEVEVKNIWPIEVEVRR